MYQASNHHLHKHAPRKCMSSSNPTFEMVDIRCISLNLEIQGQNNSEENLMVVRWSWWIETRNEKSFCLKTTESRDCLLNNRSHFLSFLQVQKEVSLSQKLFPPFFTQTVHTEMRVLLLSRTTQPRKFADALDRMLLQKQDGTLSPFI